MFAKPLNSFYRDHFEIKTEKKQKQKTIQFQQQQKILERNKYHRKSKFSSFQNEFPRQTTRAGTTRSSKG